MKFGRAKTLQNTVKPNCRRDVITQNERKREETRGNERKVHLQSDMCFQFDKNIHKTPTGAVMTKKMQKGRGSAFCVLLLLQRTKGDTHTIRTIDIGLHRQGVMYAYMH